jgi:predicted nuclease with TOPRIM domain
MTSFIREPCMDCFRKDKKIEELQDEVERLRSLADSLGEDNTRYLREIERLRAPHQEPKPDLRALLPELAVIRQVMKEREPKPD